MNIIDAFKKKFGNEVVDKEVLYKQRKQLNFEVNAFLKLRLIKLAAEYGVHLYPLMEHISQIGLFYLDKAQENPKIKDIVRNHIIDQHLISSTDTDPEEILRLGEGRYSSELLLLANNVHKKVRKMEKLFYQAQRTGDYHAVERAKKELIRSTLGLAQWLSDHPLDEMEEEGDS